jgi:hypothetical protein
MQSEYLVCEFAKETLSNLVRERFGTEFPDINDKVQVKYLFNYLKDLGAQTILLESDYVDHDYLEDYSRYYVKCFNRYGERCARLHFFSDDFDHADFSKNLLVYDQTALKSLSKSYLGFIVVKPLPKTFIGKTCLKNYSSVTNSNERKVLTRQYNVNLFGISLTVQTVAFQEQDKVISACATTAIWTALQALDTKDIRNVPSCSEITISAINHINESSNSFPNKGLTNKQILRALDTQKLRNHKINIDSTKHEGLNNFFNIVKSYIDSDLPVILGADIHEIIDEELSKLDGHAVTIVGYKETASTRALYIHDDRIGPFARAEFGSVKSKVKSIAKDDIDITESWCLSLQEKNDDGDWEEPTQLLVPDSLIIPNYKKVRISSDYIENTCNSILDEYQNYYQQYIESGVLKQKDLPQLTYQILLTNSANLKSRIIKQKNIVNKEEILSKSFARHLWVATFNDKDGPLFEILFDSTEIPQGDAVSDVIIYNKSGYESVMRPLNNLLALNQIPSETQIDFFASFVKSLRPKEVNYSEYLNQQFGNPRAPKRINKEEVIGNQLYNQDGIRYYGREEKSLADDFSDLKPDDEESFKIWVISQDGALLIGDEIDNRGHPTLTGFKSARIAGELRLVNDKWKLNAKSGRYSSNYTNSNELLVNARQKFLEIYTKLGPDEIEIVEYHG